MVSIPSLWLPILLSAVLVFLVSSIIHMLLPYHRSDVQGAPGEDELMSALRRLQVPPGTYEIPHPASPKERSSPEFAAKAARGPNALLTVVGGPPNMGMLLSLWFLYTIAVGIVAAYIAGRALAPGAPYLEVFRFAGAAAFTGYAVALWQDSIWFARSWGTTLKFTFDGLVYALLTAGMFGWLWPA